MPKVTILLAPVDVLRESYFHRDAAQMVRDALGRFERVEMGHMTNVDSAQDAADEMFDLTNNPYRQDEREEKYGTRRSLSVGDVVEVDGVQILCKSFGWETL